MSNLNMPVKFCTDENGNPYSPVVYQESMFNDDASRMDPVPRKMFAKAYDPTKTYPTENLFCIQDNKYYKFTGSGTTTGTFDPTKWTETDAAEEFTALNSTLALLSEVSHLQMYRFWNSTTSFTFDVGFTPSGGDTGTYLLISRENIYLINISDNDNITITLLHGTNTASISMSGTVVTITTAGRLWGSSFIIGIHRYS